MTLVGLGILGVIQRSFTPTWAGVPKSVPGRGVLVYLSALISLGTGMGLLWQRSAATAARVLLGALLLWLLLLRVPLVFRAPGATGAWWTLGDTAAMAAAAWVLYVWLAGDRDRQRVRFATGESGLRIARGIYGLALIPFGVAHFTYLERTVSMVPGWLPWHLAWAYFTGGALVAAGVAVLIGVFRGWPPPSRWWSWACSRCWCGYRSIVAGPDASQWTEFVSSWALTAGAWMVADSYRGVPWLARDFWFASLREP